MARRVCPDCKEPLQAPFIACSVCPWMETGVKRDAQPSRYRCAYEFDGRRCRYRGSISVNTLGGGPWYCIGHFGDSGRAGIATLEESEKISADVDYSRMPAPVVPVSNRHFNRDACEPWIAKCKQILRDAAVRHAGDAMPHILGGGALHGVEQSKIAEAERQALRAKFPALRAFETTPEREPGQEG